MFSKIFGDAPLLPILISLLSGLIIADIIEIGVTYRLLLIFTSYIIAIGLHISRFTKFSPMFSYLTFVAIGYHLLPSGGTTNQWIDHLLKIAAESQRYICDIIDNRLTDHETRAIIKSILIGEKSSLTNETKNLFRESGTIHLLAISGLHTGAIALYISYLTDIFRIKSRLKSPLTITLIWIYALVTGLSPSVVRAASIISIAIFGQSLERDYSPINAVAASALLSILINPHIIFSVGFQMSYAAYIAITLTLPIINLISSGVPQMRGANIIKALISLTLISAIAQIATIPISSHYFGTINLTAILINIVAIPISTLLLYTSITFLLLPEIISTYIAKIAETLTSALTISLETYQPYAFTIEEFRYSTINIITIYITLIILFIYINQKIIPNVSNK